MSIYAQRGNQISRIEEQQIDALVEQGFNIVDENGKVLREAVPTDIVLLKKYYVEHKQRIEELEKEIASLKKAATKKATPKEEVATEDVAEEEVVKPTKRGAKK